MDSRIILTQADFSANNIGRYVELSDLTKKVLAKQTQYDVDSEEAIALNTFLNTLTEEGLIGGADPLLKYLVIPALASNHDELLYNIAELDENGYPVNKMSDAEKNATDKVFLTYGEDKVEGMTFNNTTAIASQAIWESQQEQHVLDLLTKNANYPSLSVCMYCDGLPYDSSMLFIGGGYRVYLTKATLGIFSPNVPANYAKAAVSNIGTGFIGMNYDSTNFEVTGVLDNGTVATSESANVSALKTSNDDKYNQIYFDTFIYNRAKVKVSFVSIGKGLTNIQMTTLRDAVSTLLATING